MKLESMNYGTRVLFCLIHFVADHFSPDSTSHPP